MSDLVIDHINNNRCDNRLDNLQALTLIENHKKAQPSRNMVKVGSSPTVPVVAQNTITGETLMFKSQRQCGKYFSCSGGNISNVCNEFTYNKYLKLDGINWTCKKATEDELRDLSFTTVPRRPIVNTG